MNDLTTTESVICLIFTIFCVALSFVIMYLIDEHWGNIDENESEKEHTCEYCGSILSPKARTCKNCGAPVKKGN